MSVRNRHPALTHAYMYVCNSYARIQKSDVGLLVV